MTAPHGGLSRATALPGLDPARYRRHALHGEQAIWPEKNCYIDLWIELVHALGADPHAMLGICLPIDFEGDQWTFFKPSHDELRSLYGLDVQELTIWRPLVEHALEHLAAGKLVSVEADAWWLPDTAGTDYRHKHTKTTIVLADVDLAARRLVYFHNAGCYELTGEDFDQTFRLGQPEDPAYLPLFAEVIRSDRLCRRSAEELHRLARASLPALLARGPRDNPVRRFEQRFNADLPWLREQGLDHYHAWAFAGTRQLGAAFELVAHWLAWWMPAGEPGRDEAVAACAEIGQSAKSLILKGARAVMNPKPADLSGLFGGMADAWERSREALGRVAG
jgi:Domain of unknown function (DUF1839)